MHNFISFISRHAVFIIYALDLHHRFYNSSGHEVCNIIIYNILSSFSISSFLQHLNSILCSIIPDYVQYRIERSCSIFD